MATNVVKTTWKENMQFETDNPSGHKVFIDTSAEHGGNDTGLRPKAMMLSSLAGCSGLDVVSLLKKMRAEVDDLTIEVHGELTDEHPKFYHKVQVDYHFYGSEMDETKITKAVNLSVDTYCGVMEMFRKFADVKTNIYLHEK